MSAIYFRAGADNLIPLSESGYAAEDDLQKLIAEHPVLLCGDQIKPDAPRRWILVAREMTVPQDESGSALWYLDHLFLDQDGIPTLVEAKRSSDSRIRREVVGQMLDYAANGTVFWRTDELQECYHGDLAADLLLTEEQANDYWNQVDRNLKAGRIRMIFAADAIPDSLRRIIEFLNNQMQNTEVLGLEIKQYISEDGQQMLLPRIIGKTLQATDAKERQKPKQWDKASFLEDIARSDNDDMRHLAERLIDDYQALGYSVWYGKGATHGSIVVWADNCADGAYHSLFSLYPGKNGCYLELQFQYFGEPFSELQEKQKLRREFERIFDIQIADSRLNGRPSMSAKKLLDETVYQSFRDKAEEMLHIWKGTGETK